MLDDALEESFNDILEDEKKADAVVFSADDFMPLTGTLAPPQEKPPPLPAVPPPDIIDVSLDDTVDDHDTISDDEHLADDEECHSWIQSIHHHHFSLSLQSFYQNKTDADKININIAILHAH